MEIESTQTTEFEKIVVPEDMYEAILVEVRDIPDGQYGARIAAVFSIDTKEGAKEVSRVCSKKITPNTALGKIVLAMGAEITEGKMSMDELYGKPCRILIKNYKDNDGDQRSGVDNVLKSAANEIKTEKV